jgi:hypothetical protein
MQKIFKAQALHFYKNKWIYSILLKIIAIFITGLFFRFMFDYTVNLSTFKVFISFVSSIFIAKGSWLIELLFNDSNFIFKNNPNNIILRLSENARNLSLKNECKCKIHWHTIGQFSGKYKSYYEFKDKWNIDVTLVDYFKEEYKEKKDKIILNTKTLYWLITRRNS